MDPLPDSFEIPEAGPLKVFSQWVEIMPTKQVVPVDYDQNKQ